MVYDYIGITVITLAALISIFALPSTFYAYKIEPFYINKALSVLQNKKIDSKPKIEIVQANINILEITVKSRVKGIKAIIAFVFASNVLINKKIINIELFTNFKFESVFFNLTAVLVCLYLLTECYSKFVGLIFDMANVACNEHKYNLEENI